MNQLLLLTVIASVIAIEPLSPSCQNRIFCNSRLLHHVQLARLYSDSKTFVDLHLRDSEATIFEAFENLLNDGSNPTKEQLQEFVDKHFDSTSELEEWMPPDYSNNPLFLQGIKDKKFKQFAKDINDIWPTLGRRVKDEVLKNPDQFSFIPVDNGFIIPGGRFREIYYWDTYWIIKGLLISGMKDTAKGMITNLIQLLQKIGHVPNGSRWYYQERSQPPLLSAMMKIYLEETSDLSFLAENVEALEKELNYWLETQATSIEKGNQTYNLLRYYTPSTGPRPESYFEDYHASMMFDSEERRQEFYTDIKSAAESGWDFSTRWFTDSDGGNAGNLTTIHTRNIIPVDLNAIFADALENMAVFRALSPPIDMTASLRWSRLARKWRNAIDNVLWDANDGIWYDHDTTRETHRRYFYPSNVAPLWMNAVDATLLKSRSAGILQYLEKSHALDFAGGIPSSLIRSGEQWDFPNAWPPLISIVVGALESTRSDEGSSKAKEIAESWVRACHKSFMQDKQMFEKYDAEVLGQYGGGGEYVVQSGFGWSNGVVLEFLSKYGEVITAKG
jgi:alpha,alpha-trehalase